MLDSVGLFLQTNPAFVTLDSVNWLFKSIEFNANQKQDGERDEATQKNCYKLLFGV